VLSISVYSNIIIAADESLKFWKLFEKKAGSAGVSAQGSSSAKASMTKDLTIR